MIIAEIPFAVFLERNPYLKGRPLNEQFVHYNDYLQVVHSQQQSIVNRGGDSDFLLQEDGFKILQEDGNSGILIKT